MSRTPVRMALAQLSHMGLLELRETGGFFVREFTIDEVRDAIELRGVLEGTAARLAAERLVDDRELLELRRHLDAANAFTDLSLSKESPNSFERYMQANEAFHAAVVALAKSPMLTSSLEQAVSLPFASPSAMVFPRSMLSESDEALAAARAQHGAILDAIAQRQGTRAEYLAREHARLALRTFETALADEQVLHNIPGEPLIRSRSH